MEFRQGYERCFGIDKCRRLAGGTMCPAFEGACEERHTTLGRTRLLVEMVRGEMIDDDRKGEEIYEALNPR